MVAAATTPVTQPMAMAGIVTNNVMSRTLVVSRPDTLGGYERHSWRRGASTSPAGRLFISFSRRERESKGAEGTT